MSNYPLHIVLSLNHLIETGPDVYVTTMTKFIPYSYNTFKETRTHMKIIKLNSYLGETVIDCFPEILVDYENIMSSSVSKRKNLGYITHIFEDTSCYRFYIWGIHDYKDVTEFIRKINMCDMYIIPPEDLIT